jgi:hypothetical protein
VTPPPLCRWLMTVLRCRKTPRESIGAFPTGKSPPLVFESYNFSQAGAWTDTFNELIAAFQQTHPNIKVTAQKPQGNSADPATDTISSLDWCFQALVRSDGGRAISEDRTATTFAEPAAAQVVRTMQEMVKSGGHARLRRQAGGAHQLGRGPVRLRQGPGQAAGGLGVDQVLDQRALPPLGTS